MTVLTFVLQSFSLVYTAVKSFPSEKIPIEAFTAECMSRNFGVRFDRVFYVIRFLVGHFVIISIPMNEEFSFLTTKVSDDFINDTLLLYVHLFEILELLWYP